MASSKKKKIFSLLKSNNIKSKIIPYSFPLLSFGFIVYILISVVNYYVSKYG